MRFNEDSIPLADICESDSTYRVTTATTIDDLTDSIAVIGLIHPPILQRENSGYRIVSGFRRIAASRALGQKTIQTRLLPDDSDESTRVYLAIADNSLQRSLNLIESSRALNLLSRVTNDEHHLVEMAAVLTLPKNPAMIARLLPLTAMPTAIQAEVVSEGLPLSMALELDTFDIKTAEKLARIFTDLRLGLNRQRELLTHLREIAKREDRSIDAILADDEVRGITDNVDLGSVQKSGQLRALLYRWRYPSIAERSAQFNDLVKAMRLGSGIKLTPPIHFEGTAYTLSITFERFDQLADRGKSLKILRQSDALKKFLKE